ncbi:MAG: HNH endonuclease signature motif containing protein [Streptosporangiaceae bacterium]
MPEINVEIAHIHAFEANGPREIKTMTLGQRNHISNLVLLCAPCHKRVDGDEVAYPAWLLKRWKSDREAQPLGSLAGLRGLDATTMQELLDRAMAEIREDMASFADGFPELAQLLRETISSLPSLDPESLHLLDSAAARLDLPEYAPMVHVAAARLDLPDYAPMVHASARSMELPDYAPMLAQAAQKLDLVDQVPHLDRIADSLAETVASMSVMLTRAEAVTRATSVPQLTAPGYSDPVIEVRHIPRAFWKAAAIGWFGWLLAGLLIYLHVKGYF